MSLNRLTPSQRLKNQEKAYESMLNLHPAQEKKQVQERASLKTKALEGQMEDYGTGQSDSMQRFKSGGIAKEGSQMLGELQAKQESEKDALDFQGAGYKENMIGQRQSAATGDFVRKKEEEIRALQEAVTQRAFDLGMQGKELAFHNNSLVADAGFDALKRDFESGRVDRREMLTIGENQAIRALKRTNQAEQMLAIRFQEAMLAIQKGDIAEAMKRIKMGFAAQKKAAEDVARASNLGSIVGGGVELLTTVLTK